MQELRCLFALMVGSTRRFVDPSAAVELLRDAFRTSEAQQVQTFCFILFLCVFRNGFSCFLFSSLL